MPMLALTGEKASGDFLIEQARLVDTNVNGVVIKGKRPLADGGGAATGNSPAGSLHQQDAVVQLNERYFYSNN